MASQNLLQSSFMLAVYMAVFLFLTVSSAMFGRSDSLRTKNLTTYNNQKSFTTISCTNYKQNNNHLHLQQNQYCTRAFNILRMNKKNDHTTEKQESKQPLANQKAKGKPSNEEKEQPHHPPLTRAQIDQIEEQASRRNLQQLLAPYRFSEALTKVAWLFVISGFVLNAFGYGYIVQEDTHRIQIVTLDNRQFQMEMRKSMKQQQVQQQQEKQRTGEARVDDHIIVQDGEEKELSLRISN